MFHEVIDRGQTLIQRIVEHIQKSPASIFLCLMPSLEGFRDLATGKLDNRSIEVTVNVTFGPVGGIIVVGRCTS